MDDVLNAKIFEILAQQTDLTLATIRDDGYPQATTVSYVSDGLDIYFGCSPLSQKTHNLAQNDKISLTVTPPYSDWNSIKGLSIGGRAKRIVETAHIRRIETLFFKRFPFVVQYTPQDRSELALFQIIPEVITVLDYTMGFGHRDTVRLQKAG